MAERVVHAYGVVPLEGTAGLASALAATTGIGRTPVRLLELEKVAVVVGDLPADAYGEAAWRQHAEDPAWLEPVARDHHEVLLTVAGAGDVLPLRLPGVYAAEEDLGTLLGHEEDTLLRCLRSVAGHDEWGVHVHLVEAAASPAAPAQTAQTAQTALSGRDYLRQRKQQAAHRDVAWEERGQLVAEAYAGLAQAAGSSVQNRPQDRALSGRDEPMLLNSAHLVARPAREAFFARAEELSRTLLAPAGLEMEISGPWPPYNFAAPDQSRREAW